MANQVKRLWKKREKRVMFSFSKKVTKFCKISTGFEIYWVNVKFGGRIGQVIARKCLKMANQVKHKKKVSKNVVTHSEHTTFYATKVTRKTVGLF